MLYRYLRPIAGVGPGKSSGFAQYPVAGLSDFAGEWGVVVSDLLNPAATSQSPYYTVYYFGANTIHDGTGFNNAEGTPFQNGSSSIAYYDYATSKYSHATIWQIACSSIGLTATWWLPNIAVTNGNDRIDYLYLDAWTPGVGWGKAFTVGTLYPGSDSKLAFSPNGLNLMYISRSFRSGTTFSTFSENFGVLANWQTTNPTTHAGSFANSFNVGARYLNRRVAVAGWLNDTTLLAGYYTTTDANSSVTYDIYSSTGSGTPTATNVTGLPSSVATLNGNTKMISVGNNQFVIAWIGPTTTSVTMVLVQFNGSSFTTLDTTSLALSSTATVPYLAYLGGGRMMVMSTAIVPGGGLYDISAGTFNPKPLRFPKSVYGIGGHLPTGKLITVEQVPTVGTSSGGVFTYDIPVVP